MLVLASRGIRELAALVHGRAVLIPTASDGLENPGIADEVERELRGAGLSVERAPIDAPLDGFDVIAVSGGNPYHLLAEARRTGFGARVRASDAVYVGYSAGAILAGPTLEPIRLTSPFDVPPDLPLAGLALTDVVVLPHHNRVGRAERHAAAAAAFPALQLRPLNDGEYLVLGAPRASSGA